MEHSRSDPDIVLSLRRQQQRLTRQEQEGDVEDEVEEQYESYQHSRTSTNHLLSQGGTQSSLRYVPMNPLLLHHRNHPTTNAVDDDSCKDGEDGGDEYIDDDDELAMLDGAKEELLGKIQHFKLKYDAERGYRATEFRLNDWSRPHSRGFHASWICYFANYFVQYSQAPLLPQIQNSLNLTTADIWCTNMWMMIGGIPIRFLLGSLCDKYGARSTMTLVLALCAVPAIMTSMLVYNLFTLVVCRTLLGAMDVFVCGQYWITCLYVREVGGTAMALSSGFGASGSGITQLITGSIIYPFMLYVFQNIDIGPEVTVTTADTANASSPSSSTGTTATASVPIIDDDIAWRVSLVIPALLALLVAYFFYCYSDDCPFGNYREVKRAGLMIERSAVDSFRSGAVNLNAWLLFIQVRVRIVSSVHDEYRLCS